MMNLSDDLISFEYPLGSLFLGNIGLALFINALSFKSIPYFELVGNSIFSGKLSIKLDL